MAQGDLTKRESRLHTAATSPRHRSRTGRYARTEWPCVVITRLDRLARSTRDLLDVAEQIQDAKAGLRSLAEPWADTTSPAGGMVLTVFAGIAEFERALIHQRTSAGRIAARQRGVRFGRTPKLGPEHLVLARRLVDAGRPVREVAGMLKCHRTTLYRALDALDRESGPAASDGSGMSL